VRTGWEKVEDGVKKCDAQQAEVEAQAKKNEGRAAAGVSELSTARAAPQNQESRHMEERTTTISCLRCLVFALIGQHPRLVRGNELLMVLMIQNECPASKVGRFGSARRFVLELACSTRLARRPN
jgi:hypothetical protein